MFRYTNSLDIMLSNTCNLRCDHCCVRNKLNGKEVNWSKIDSLLKENHNIRSIRIGGGEPLYSDDNASHILDLMHRYSHIQWYMTTNLCYPLTEMRMKVLDKIHSLSTSFDIGIRFRNIRNLVIWYTNCKKIISNRSLGVYTCLTKYMNLDRIKRLVKVYNHMGFYRYAFVPMRNPYGKDMEYLVMDKSQMLEIMKYLINVPDNRNALLEVVSAKEFGRCYNISPYNNHPLDSDGKLIACLVDNKEHSVCGLHKDCIRCEIRERNECKGRCEVLPCYYDKDIFNTAKEVWNEVYNKWGSLP